MTATPHPKPIAKAELVTHPLDKTPQPLKRTKPFPKAEESKQRRRKKPKRLFSQIIFRDWCKACGICSAFCPKDVIGVSETGEPVIERPDDCIGCRFCELHCPDFAITIKERNGGEPRNPS
ncbi:MAG: 4Fe-4S binding protein [Thermodesulfobacteriota bacterium]|nr:4Fe-4S binding protein [Thermodesulfobacteriota bacterium]